MFKFSDIKAGDILIASDPNEHEYRVLNLERREDAYYFYIESLQNHAKYSLRVREGDEYKLGVSKIVHA